MDRERPIKEVLKEIESTKAYHLLDQFTHHTLSQEERVLLADLYATCAEELIKKDFSLEGIERAKKAFDKSLELAPSDANLWHKKALSLASHKVDEAQRCFETAAALAPASFESWYAWGSFLLQSAKKDSKFIDTAEGKFLQAEGLIKKDATNVHSEKRAEFYWQWGVLHSLLFRYSGEAYDAHKAISHFRRASQLGTINFEYYEDFSSVLIELGGLLNQESYLFEAIKLSHSFLREDGKKNNELYGLSYFNLGLSYHTLFKIRLEQQYFLLANECYEKSIHFNQLSARVLSEWGALLITASKMFKESCYLWSSINKLTEALKHITNDDPIILANLAEAKATLGNNEDNFELLQEAKALVERGKASFPLSEELFIASSIVLIQHGNYFADSKYYEDAISQAKEGYKIYPRSGKLSYHLAMAKCFLGESRQELAIIQDALLSYDQAAKSELSKAWYFWNDWGMTLFDLAEQTQEKKYLLLAEEKFEQAILRHEMIDTELLLNYGCTLDFLGDVLDDWVYYDRAIQVLSSALALDPTATHVRFHLACSYVHIGDELGDVDAFLKADYHFQQTVLDDPEDGEIWNEWGVSLIHYSELISDSMIHNDNVSLLRHRSEQYFIKALSLGDQAGYYSLACLYSLQGNILDAVHNLEKACDSGTLPSREALLDDDWLENVRKTSYFNRFLES